jgi:hypothetical protein
MLGLHLPATHPIQLREQRWHVLFLPLILFGRTKTTSPTPLFDSLWKNKDNKTYTSLWFSLQEQRQQDLHLYLMLFARTKTTSPTPLFDSLWKNKYTNCTPLFNSLWKIKTTSPTPFLDSLWKNEDGKSFITLWFSLHEQRRHVLNLSSILFDRTMMTSPRPLFDCPTPLFDFFGRTKTPRPIPLFDSLCKHKDDVYYSSLLFFLQEQRQRVLFLSSILFTRTKTTSPRPLFDGPTPFLDSLCKNKDDKFCISLRFSLVSVQ